VVFDFDGVLVDSAIGIRYCLDVALRSLELDVASAVEARSLLGPPLHAGMTQVLLGRGEDPALADRLVERFRAEYVTASLQMTRVFPEVPEMLRELLRRGKQIGLATSKPAPATHALLDHLDLRAHLHPVGCPVDVVHDTKTDVLREVLRCAGMADDAAVMIGDRRHDIEAARALGLRSIGVLWGYGSTEELATAGADVLVSSPTDVPDAVEALR
jgi:phosphoglycolate phosphatase